jgi:hypothetical protein
VSFVKAGSISFLQYVFIFKVCAALGASGWELLAISLVYLLWICKCEMLPVLTDLCQSIRLAAVLSQKPGSWRAFRVWGSRIKADV